MILWWGCLRDVRLEGFPLPLPPGANRSEWGAVLLAHNITSECQLSHLCQPRYSPSGESTARYIASHLCQPRYSPAGESTARYIASHLCQPRYSPTGESTARYIAVSSGVHKKIWKNSLLCRQELLFPQRGRHAQNGLVHDNFHRLLFTKQLFTYNYCTVYIMVYGKNFTNYLSYQWWILQKVFATICWCCYLLERQ